MKRYFPIQEANKIIEDFSSDLGLKNKEIIPWITIKVLRIKKKDYPLIKKINIAHLEQIKKAIKRYINGESLSQIFGYIEFYNLNFEVTKNIFDPRLSSQTLIDAFLKKVNKKDVKVLDLCSGSGCIAITISKLLNIKTEGCDISNEAILIANKNNKKLKANSCFFSMDIFEDWDNFLNKKYDVIISNPPYFNIKKIVDKKDLTPNNPLNAFYGGEKGLKFFKSIVNNAPYFLNEKGLLFLEMDEDQEEAIKKMMLFFFEDIKVYKDHNNIKRVISGSLKKK